jgi:hypothetical protein
MWTYNGDFLRIYKWCWHGGTMLYQGTWNNLVPACTSSTGPLTIVFANNLDNNVAQGFA